VEGITAQQLGGDAMTPAVAEELVKADTNDRRTPGWFFRQCEARYGKFDVDAAASSENFLARHWFGPGSPDHEDGLAADWSMGFLLSAITVWCNCPYGPAGTIPKWITKARKERDAHGVRTLMLLPADTSTQWYHDVSRTELYELVPFRLAFDAPDGSTNGDSAKFGSVLVWIAPRISNPVGAVGRRRKQAVLPRA
jgi:phage N-6-adenine-methyltransferase